MASREPTAAASSDSCERSGRKASAETATIVPSNTPDQAAALAAAMEAAAAVVAATAAP